MQDHEFIRFALERIADLSFSLSDLLPSGAKPAAAPPGFYDLLPPEPDWAAAAALELPAPGGAWAPTERMGLP